jgi:prolipoprotein diacylglyceryltransferase
VVYLLGVALAIWILVRLSRNDASQQDDYAFAIAGIFVGLSGALGRCAG